MFQRGLDGSALERRHRTSQRQSTFICRAARLSSVWRGQVLECLGQMEIHTRRRDDAPYATRTARRASRTAARTVAHLAMSRLHADSTCAYQVGGRCTPPSQDRSIVLTDLGCSWLYAVLGPSLPQFSARSAKPCAGTRLCQCTPSRPPPDVELKPEGGLRPYVHAVPSAGGCRWEPYALGHWTRGHFCVRRAMPAGLVS